MLDHLDDLDADFLAFYRIDLRDPATEIDAETFFARAARCFSMRGALRDALLAEREARQSSARPPVAATGPARRDPDAPEPGDEVDATGTCWVSPERMQALFPDLF